MKKVLLVALLAIGVSAASYAQGGFNQTPDQQLERLKTQVTGITDAQSAKLKPIFEARAKSLDSLRTALGDNMQEMFTKMTPITASTTAKIKSVLTAEQIPAYQKVLDAQAERMKQFQQGQN